MKADELDLTIVRGKVAESSTANAATSSLPSNGPGPVCRFVNIELCGTSPSAGARGTQGTVLLENPRGDFPLSFSELLHQVRVVESAQRSSPLYFTTT